jgi:hypothetical protein
LSLACSRFGVNTNRNTRTLRGEDMSATSADVVLPFPFSRGLRRNDCKHAGIIVGERDLIAQLNSFIVYDPKLIYFYARFLHFLFYFYSEKYI